MQDDRLKRNAIFMLKFFVIYGVLQAIIDYAPMTFITESIARFEGALISRPVIGSSIYVDGVEYIITNSCTGFVSLSILAAVVFGLRKPEIKKKVLLLGLGALILLPSNLVRVFAVLIVGANFGPFWADLTHKTSWFMMSGLIIGVWYYATKRFAGIRNFHELL
jgi:exosortase/archaeosortase family protein